jgi:phospholipid/cholesterol/gamma-HCH transport system substrate-binding protein
MENRAHALAAGLFVMILSMAVIATASWFTGDTGTRDKYLVVSESPVTGLNAQATVRYRGVTVGKVENISLDPNNHRVILIRIAVDKNVPLNTKAYAQLGYQGLTGLAFVQLNEESDGGERLITDPDNPKIPARPSALDSITQGQRLLGKPTVWQTSWLYCLRRKNQKIFRTYWRMLRTWQPPHRVVNQRARAETSARSGRRYGTLLGTDQLVLNLNGISTRINEPRAVRVCPKPPATLLIHCISFATLPKGSHVIRAISIAFSCNWKSNPEACYSAERHLFPGPVRKVLSRHRKTLNEKTADLSHPWACGMRHLESSNRYGDL